MYLSKYYTCEEIDERLLKGYYDDAVSKGYTGSLDMFQAELASSNFIDLYILKNGTGYSYEQALNIIKETVDSISVGFKFRYLDTDINMYLTVEYLGGIITSEDSWQCQPNSVSISIDQLNSPSNLFTILLGKLKYKGYMYVVVVEGGDQVGLLSTLLDHQILQTELGLSEDKTAISYEPTDSVHIYVRAELGTPWEDIIGDSESSDSQSIGLINLATITAAELLSMAREVKVGNIKLYLITDSTGKFPSTETRINVNSEITSLINVKGTNVGDAFIIGMLTESQPIFKVLPLFNAKIAENGFYGTEGIMTPSDKIRINKVDTLETTVSNISRKFDNIEYYGTVINSGEIKDTKEFLEKAPCICYGLNKETDTGITDSIGLFNSVGPDIYESYIITRPPIVKQRQSDGSVYGAYIIEVFKYGTIGSYWVIECYLNSTGDYNIDIPYRVRDNRSLISYPSLDSINANDYLTYSVYIRSCNVTIDSPSKTIEGCSFISRVYESGTPSTYFIEQYIIGGDNDGNKVYYRYVKSINGTISDDCISWRVLSDILNYNYNLYFPKTPDSCIGKSSFTRTEFTLGGDNFNKLLSLYKPADGQYDGVTTQILLSELDSTSPYMRIVSGSSESHSVIKDWFNIGGCLTRVSYAGLVKLRDSQKLVPGMEYCIYDYKTTTTWEDTQSADHRFCVIVKATSTSTLSENAKVDASGINYFNQTKYNTWQIKYCLDNDTTRFAWADTENGKGVIYYMKDEYNNECPYDFKNIQFKRYKITACPKSPSLVGRYSINGIDGITVDTDNPIWAYTFSVTQDGEIKDASSLKQNLDNLNVYDNAIKVTTWVDNIENDGSILPWFLNNIVFISVDETLYCNSNTFGNGCSSNTFGNYCHSNTFGNYCYSNTFGDGCDSNTFGNGCDSNTFGNYCHSNTFGNYCYSNTFGDGCYSNTFGNYCHSNTFGNYCHYNTFGNGCSSNTFGNYCSSNTFGNYCHSNTFGNYCHYNTFGNGCSSNTFGNYCSSNTFGNGCDSNTFGNYCHSNTFGNYCNSNTLNKDKGGFARYIIIENGNRYITLNSSTTASSSNYLQNITIAQGYNNTTTKVTITHPTLRDTFRTVYQNPNSKVVEFKDGTRVEYNLSELKAAIDANTTEIETVKASLLKSNYVEDVQDITIQ